MAYREPSWHLYSPVGEDPEDTRRRESEKAYKEFATGLTFGDVRRLLAVEQRHTRDFTGDYMYVSRSTVLGRWHEIKQAMWRGEPPPEELEGGVDCLGCHDVVDLEEICADCGDCHECCICVDTPEDDFYRENPMGENTRWLLVW